MTSKLNESNIAQNFRRFAFIYPVKYKVSGKTFSRSYYNLNVNLFVFKNNFFLSGNTFRFENILCHKLKFVVVWKRSEHLFRFWGVDSNAQFIYRIYLKIF